MIRQTVIALMTLSTPALAGSPAAVAAEAITPASGTSAWYAYGALGYSSGKPTYDYSGMSTTEFDVKGASATLGVGRTFFQRGAMTIAGEADITGGDIGSDVIASGTAPCYGSPMGLEGCEAKVDWLATVRVVLGWQMGATMPYVTAGLAAGNINGFADLGACGSTSTCGFDETRTGWTAGIGIRHEMNARWAIKGDILHVDLGEPEFSASSVTAKGFDFNQLRLGAIFKF